MSKLARKPILTRDVQVFLKGSLLSVSGKHGELSLDINPKVSVVHEDHSLYLSSSTSNLLGLYCALVKNMIYGVQHKFTESLVLKGVGYRVSLSGNQLTFNLGYSHPVVYTLPNGIEAQVENPTEIIIKGIDKQMVGQVSAEIIKLRPAKKDPYKEKGIKRTRDRILKKVGKKVK